MKNVTIETLLADTSKTPKERISTLTSLAYAAIAEAEVIAEEHSISFSFGDRLGYGMGGTFGESWDASSDEEGNVEYTWMASSQSC